MPSTRVGLGLAERVVRRHVARLEAIGWLERKAGIRGEGSLVWLTSEGLAGVGLGKLAAVRAPAAFSLKTMHSVQVAWVAAELERGSLQWRAVRELALDREQWAVKVANERGGTSRRLPDLVAWPSQSRRPVAVVLEPGQRNERRQRAALEGWQAAIREGRYAQVRYKTDPVTARQLERLAAPLGLTAPAFLAVERLTADTLVAPPAAVKPDTTTTAAQTPPAPVSVPPPPPPAPNPDPRLQRLRSPQTHPRPPLALSAPSTRYSTSCSVLLTPSPAAVGAAKPGAHRLVRAGRSTVRAHGKGTRPPALLVEAALEGRQTPAGRREEIAALFEIRRLLATVANDINQLARSANISGQLTERLRLDRTLGEVDELLGQLRGVAGRL